MIDNQRRIQKQEEKERTRRRMRVEIDPDNYTYIPAKKPIDFYDNEVNQRVAIYVRVSTDDVRQTTSFELQKKYYEDFVVRHPNWTLVKIYADEGISGTSLAHRDEFNRMISDCRAGNIDLVITKSVSRFARNIMICIGMVRELAELNPPVGVFFESECIFSLNEDSQMALSFQATMAEEESHIRSRSMETSLRMRLDNGIPLTPKLLGYTHDSEGNLIVNPEEAPTVKLAFYMYLYGYSTQQIADIFISLGRKSYLGNIKWTSGSIVQILRNERHCGDVLTRKTFTPNFRDHKSRKNRGERPQSRYSNHHEGIVTRDDFIAVQQLLDNAKYRNKAFLPQLRVINSGLFKGYVIVNPRWAGFSDEDYYRAAQSIYCGEGGTEQGNSSLPDEIRIEVNAGDFDLRGFEIARSELFGTTRLPYITFSERTIRLSSSCVKKYGVNNHLEMLINPITRQFAVRSTGADNRNGVICSATHNGKIVPKDIQATAFHKTLFSLFQWDDECRYRINGTMYAQGNEIAYIFEASDAEAYFKPNKIHDSSNDSQPLMSLGKRVKAVPEEWATNFGKQYYFHKHTLEELEKQSESDWKIRMEGQLYETGKRLSVTGFDELRQYIRRELSEIINEENTYE